MYRLAAGVAPRRVTATRQPPSLFADFHAEKVTMIATAHDLTGQRFGRLTAICSPRANKQGNRLWMCHCDCGGVALSTGSSLKAGRTQSCGCIKLEIAIARLTIHGRVRTPEYRAWHHAKERCFNQVDKQYADYGGRGIRMCKRWSDNFVNFIEDIGDKPTSKHSLDRTDNMGHYSCGKCEECRANEWTANYRWADAKQQARNRRPRKKRVEHG